jgi:hypothetical protein
MNKAAVALGIACVTLAALDVKLLYDLRALRAAATQPEGATDAAGAQAGGGSSASSRPRDSRGKSPSPSARQRASDADFIRMNSDPRTRPQLIAEYAMDGRDALRGVDRALDIPWDRWEMLNLRLAELAIEQRVRTMECAGDLVCARDVLVDQHAKGTQVEVEVLGAVKAGELKQHRQSLDERRAVDGFQSRLGDSRLTREQSEELIRTLYEEGMRVKNGWDLKKDGSMRWYSTGFAGGGRAYYPDTATTHDQRMAAATDYSRHMRDRAAPLLNVEQRAAFEAMQDDLLERFDRRLRRDAAEGG